MKLSSYVVKQVHDLLVTNKIGITTHMDVKPTKSEDSEYIVINTTGLDAEYIQEGFVNINCHVKNMGLGVPNHARLDAIGYKVLTIIENAGFVVQDSNMRLILELRRSEKIPEKSPIEEYYFNLFFKVIIHKN